MATASHEARNDRIGQYCYQPETSCSFRRPSDRTIVSLFVDTFEVIRLHGESGGGVFRKGDN